MFGKQRIPLAARVSAAGSSEREHDPAPAPSQTGPSRPVLAHCFGMPSKCAGRRATAQDKEGGGGALREVLLRLFAFLGKAE